MGKERRAGGWVAALLGMRIGELAGWTLGVGLLLQFLEAMLYSPTGWSISHFLRWTDLEGPIRAITGIWNLTGTVYAAYLYLTVDTLVFMPLYALLVLRLTAALQASFHGIPNATAARAVGLIALATRVGLVLLLAADLAENLAGFARLGAAAAVQSAPLAGLSGTLVRGLISFGAWASGAKSQLMATLLGPAVLAAMWFTGAGFSGKAKARRGRFRAAVGDMLVRSRYVLIALLILAGLTIVMDQARDVVYAMAVPWLDQAKSMADEPQAWIDSAKHIAGSIVVVIASMIALWLLVFACWLWTRSVCQVRSAATAALPGPHVARPYESAFARVWARVLGVAPVWMLLLLLTQVVKDTAQAQALVGGAGRATWWSAAAALGFWFLALLAFGGWFLRRRAAQRSHGKYYDALTWEEWCRATGFNVWNREAEGAKYRFWGFVPPAWLPVLLMLGMLAFRLFDILPWGEDVFPTMTLAVILSSVALWLCLFGWLSLLEVRRSIPWVGLLILWVALFSALGLTDNHLVWTGTGIRWPLYAMWIAAAAIAIVLLLGYALALRFLNSRLQPEPGPLLGRRVVPGIAAIVAATALVVWAAPFVAAKARTPAQEGPGLASRPSAPQAMAAWLKGLCNADAGGACQPREAKAARDGQGHPVYFVSSEGGGIRAAAWTALALRNLLRQDEHFLDRTFSISGVSGGSVGAAALRACHLQAVATGGDAANYDRVLDRCLGRWAATDYLSPLLSSWMFEDVLARIIPTAGCDLPGCGFLSRAAWFEQTFEQAVPALTQPLLATRRTRATGWHVPYLLLNATWVESGERAIASDLQVRPRYFPGAKDQLDLLGRDLSLGTAAHNSARFPYTNAIGVLRTTRALCNDRSGGRAGPWPEKELVEEVCGHLADGGYFDNSGAQSTVDLLNVFRRCLDTTQRDPGDPEFDACADLPQREWLRRNLVPHVIMIRNGVEFTSRQDAACLLRDPAREPATADVRVPASADCGEGTRYVPEQPICQPAERMLVELTGPPITVLRVSGIGANGRTAEARQAQLVSAVRAGSGAAGSVIALDLVRDGVRYPLGWHLSPRARSAIERQAKNCKAVPLARSSGALALR